MTRQLGIDLGTGSVKALIMTETGETLARGAADYPIHRPGPNRAEQDPAEWRRATVAAVRQALNAAGSSDISAIGLSGQMHGAVPIDAAGDVVRPAVIWADGRSVQEAAEITEIVGARRLIEISGSPVVSGFQAATCRWLSKHERENWAKTAVVLTPKDELRRWLTGEIATEPSDASATLLFDVERAVWAPELLAAANVRSDQVPRAGHSAEISGVLCAPVAVEFGLRAGIPVSGGVADAPGAALGAGIGDSNTLMLTISSGAQALMLAERPLIDPIGRIHSFCGPLDAPRWYAMGATLSAGLSLRWLRDNVFELDPKRAYETMLSAAEQVAPGAGGLVFLPYLTGERTPLMDPLARGVFLGLTGSHGRGNLVRAVLEGVAFSMFEAFAILKELGAAPARIVLAGGGARAPLWRQIMADVFGLPVTPALDPDQSAIGAAMTAGAAIGAFTLAEASRTWPLYDGVVEPNQRNSVIYQKLIPIFRSAYIAHKTDFERLESITTPT